MVHGFPSATPQPKEKQRMKKAGVAISRAETRHAECKRMSKIEG
jgi:hypothetical protein